MSPPYFVSLCAMLLVAAPAAVMSHDGAHDGMTYGVAVLDQGGADNNVTGSVYIQTSRGPVTTIKGIISGLSPGLHGFRIHEVADYSNGCTSTLGHWNPDKTNHGAPSNAETGKHLGDLGNINADKTGVAYVNVTIANDLIFELFNANDTVRSFVVHEGEDDLGLGNAVGSLTTGNAGGRLKCGSIVKFEPIVAMANITNGPAEGDNIAGTIYMEQDAPGMLHVDVELGGIPAGRTHGLHIHTGAATDEASCGAEVTGGHYNPLGRAHSGPQSNILERHVGDFGNIASDETGTVNVSLESEDVYLWGPYSVVGRAWVLHAGVDDLGLGGDNASLTTGNAGGRVKCGTIEVQTDVMSNPPEDDKITNNTPEADDDNGALSFGLFWAQVLPAVLMLLALLA